MKSETGVKDFSRTPPPASLVPLPFQGRLLPLRFRGAMWASLHIPRKAILHTNSNAHVNSFTTAGMVSMDTSVVTAKMWEA